MCGERPTITRLLDYEAYCGAAPPEHAMAAGPAEREINALTLAERLRRPDPPMVVDVREQWEWEIAHIEGSRLVPLWELGERLGELNSGVDVVTVCHTGMRSLTAQQLLQGAGFRARSLAGGIERWAVEVDRGMARY